MKSAMKKNRTSVAKGILIILFAGVAMLFLTGLEGSHLWANEGAGETFKHSFGARDFKMNQDALKYEVPQNGTYKIMPRLKNADIWSHFPIPNESQALLDWHATAVVLGSDGPAGGVGLWCENNTGWVAGVFPDGKGFFRQYEGKKQVWNSGFSIANFSYPANIAIWRDANGSVIAKVDGVVVAAKLFDVDVKKPKTEKVTSVSFATFAGTAKLGVPVTYERLDVEASGTRKVENLFRDTLFKDEAKN